MCVRVWSLGFGVWGLGLRVWGLWWAACLKMFENLLACKFGPPGKTCTSIRKYLKL